VFNIIKKLMMARQINLEEGYVTILGQPVVIQPLTTWITLQRKLEKTNSIDVIYTTAKEAATSWIMGLKKSNNMTTSQLVEWGVNTMSFAGWGRTEIVNYDQQNKRAILHIRDSTFAKAYGRSEDPVDHIKRGFLAGSGCVYFNDNVDCVETKCISCGAGVCEFVVKRTSEFEDSALVKKQLGLKKK